MIEDESATARSQRLIRELSDQIVAAVHRPGEHPAEALVIAMGIAARVLVATAPAQADAVTLRTFDEKLRNSVARLRRSMRERAGGIGDTQGTA